jgi:Na+/proline symporter
MADEKDADLTPAPPNSSSEQQIVYVERQKNGMAVAALVLGIVGAVFGLIPLTFIIAFICGTLGVIFGVVGWRKANRGLGRKGMAISGFILGIIAVLLAVAGVVIVDEAVTDLDRGLQEIETSP